MKNQVMRTASGMLVLGALLFAVAPAMARTTSPAAGHTARVVIDDDQLEDAIEKAWKADAKLSARKLDVSVDKGIATISGDVLNAAEKARAEKLAHVPGVTSVKSEIKINPDTRSVADKATDAARSGGETAANKGAEGVGVAADKTKEAASKSANAVSDTWITTKVKSKMVGDKVLKGSDIDVSTDGGIVTLTGKVLTEAQRKHAITVAKGTKGTKDVVDKLTITSSGTH